MKLSEAIKQRILNLCEEKNYTLHRLSLRSGIAYSTLNSFTLGKCKSPTLVTILLLCEGFDIELKDFFNDKLFDNVEYDD